MGRRVMILDTTLRDGEQTPGAKLNAAEKLEVARQLERLGVDVIEAGFPASSPGDEEAVRQIAREVRRPVITALARARRDDIDAVWRAVGDAQRPRIHLVLGTSDQHIEHKLRRSREQVMQMAVDAVAYAKALCDDVQYSPEDATRSDFDYLAETVARVIEAGATVVNIADTVGWATPDTFAALISRLRSEVPNIGRATLSVHCHNDLGLATANTLAGIAAGADQAEACVNGVGERAGNAALEEVVMALHVRPDLYGARTDIATGEITRTSRLVSALTGMPIQANKAIVGANAFRHSSGIHIDGILKDRRNYEIIQPEQVGAERHRFVLTSRSGRHALRHALETLGHHLDERAFETFYERFIDLADKKKEVAEADLEALMGDAVARVPETYELDYLHTLGGNRVVPTATVRLRRGEQLLEEAASGDGMVDAACRAIDRATGLAPEMIEYSVRSVTGGKEALGEVVLRVAIDGQTVTGRAVGTDVVEASARAYLQALNRWLMESGAG